jgi:hypothetical protein
VSDTITHANSYLDGDSFTCANASNPNPNPDPNANPDAESDTDAGRDSDTVTGLPKLRLQQFDR